MIYVTLLSMPTTPIILGIDPGTQILGYALLKGILKDVNIKKRFQCQS